MIRFRRITFARASAALAAATAVIVGLACVYLLRDPKPRMLERRSALAEARVDSSIVSNGYLITPVRLRAESGIEVRVLVRQAIADSGRKLPVAMILGGHYTGHRSVEMVGEVRDLLVVGVSYPFDGDPRPSALTFLSQIPAIRGAFLDTPPAMMLVVDYLLTRDDVDPTRLEAVGVSLGAPFVTIAGALDDRISRVWAMHGSGGSYAPLESNMRRAIGVRPLRMLAAGVANVIINGPGLDPVRWVADIAPREFVMVNAVDDERMPRHAVDALYASAREPKEQIWMPGRHIRADSATISALVRIVTERVRGDLVASADAIQSPR